MAECKLTATSKFAVLDFPLLAPSIYSSESEDSCDNNVYSRRNDDENTVDLLDTQHQFAETIVASSSYDDACNLSKVERRKEECNGDITLTYGEVLFHSFRDALLPILTEYGGLPSGAKFYDLGSGRGRYWLT